MRIAPRALALLLAVLASLGLSTAPASAQAQTWDQAWASGSVSTLRSWFVANTGPRVALSTTTNGLYTVTNQTTANALSGRTVNGRVLVTASNVTLQDFKVVGDGSGAANIELSGSLTNVTIRYAEVNGAGLLTPLACLGGSSFARGTFSNLKLHDCLDRVRLMEGSSYTNIFAYAPVVNPNYVPGTSSQHADAAQAVRAASPISIAKSWLESAPMGPNVTSSVIVKTDSAAISGVTVDRSYLNGGKYSAIVEAGAFGAPTGVSFTNNRFGHGYGDGLWSGAGVTPATVTRTGNVWADTLAPVPLTWGFLPGHP